MQHESKSKKSKAKPLFTITNCNDILPGIPTETLQKESKMVMPMWIRFKLHYETLHLQDIIRGDVEFETGLTG
jgi:hypothetical protein